jgi:type IV pilus biogenesis protein CpaD/CtpE
MRIQRLVFGAALGAVVAAAGLPAAAQRAIPTLSETGRPVAAADIEAETARMARRYGLSNEQAEKVRVILDEHAKKAEQMARQLTPDEAASRLKSLKDEESSWLSAVLAPEQRHQLRLDARP